ncbi:MAG: non-canonical purine NTP pyrophosphatase, RdgB/HAM1 family [Deltaproteobacteria bacterium]|nr:non-canonical purine NTP pyrophosphatase, RdgB/HAM1 family [Deltaproteobacteria bacterium]
MQIIIATNNQGKKREFQQLLSDNNVRISCLDEYHQIPDPPETKNTFDGNALQKAEFVFSHFNTQPNVIVIADDSGLCVEVLHGAPGVHSKRYSKEQTSVANNKKLLSALEGIADRVAYFHCSIAIVSHQGTHVVQGQCHGAIATNLSGTGGFGYDPLFIPDAFSDQTMATISSSQKNMISHRAHALHKALPIIQQILKS